MGQWLFLSADVDRADSDSQNNRIQDRVSSLGKLLCETNNTGADHWQLQEKTWVEARSWRIRWVSGRTSSGTAAGLYRNSIEQYNFYREEFADVENRVPECIKPFMDEITAFTEVSLCLTFERLLLTSS